jgi:hypothetical protein
MALEDILEEIRANLEDRIKRQLSGLQGLVARPVYNSMMPLHVELSLAPEVFELVFLKDGVVELRHGYGASADVRIETDSQTFMFLFQNSSAERFNELERQGKIRITSLTKKGKDAEAYIRRHLAG